MGISIPSRQARSITKTHSQNQSSPTAPLNKKKADANDTRLLEIQLTLNKQLSSAAGSEQTAPSAE